MAASVVAGACGVAGAAPVVIFQEDFNGYANETPLMSGGWTVNGDVIRAYDAGAVTGAGQTNPFPTTAVTHTGWDANAHKALSESVQTGLNRVYRFSIDMGTYAGSGGNSTEGSNSSCLQLKDSSGNVLINLAYLEIGGYQWLLQVKDPSSSAFNNAYFNNPNGSAGGFATLTVTIDTNTGNVVGAVSTPNGDSTSTALVMSETDMASIAAIGFRIDRRTPPAGRVGAWFDNVSASYEVIPEPAGMALAGLGATLMLTGRRRQAV